MEIINKIKKIKISSKTIAIILGIVFILSILPLIVIGFYNHPSADDYSYSIRTMLALKTGGIIELIKGVFLQIADTYTTWQGTYSAVAVFALQPSVFGQSFYFLSTIILLLAFIGSNYILIKEITLNYLKTSKSVFYICLFIILLFSIQTLPSLVQGFYWWNGSSYYTLFYSLFLIVIANILKLFRKDQIKILPFILLSLLVIFIAGGNFVTSLVQVVTLFIFAAYTFIFKKEKRKYLIILFVLAALGLLISMIAPGNAFRAAAYVGSSLSVIDAIKASFDTSWNYIFSHNNLLLNLLVLFVMVFMYPSYNKTKIKFKFPALVSLITFGIFTVQFTPPLYAMGNIGEARLWNIIHYSYFWLHIINVYYWIGWFRCKLIKYDIFKKESMEKLKHFVYDYSLIFIIIFALFISKPISDNFMNFSCIDTYHSLRTGEAKQYHKEYKERIKLYENKKIKNVKAKPFTAKPKALYFSDIKPDKNHWINKPITEIYGKKSVALETE